MKLRISGAFAAFLMISSAALAQPADVANKAAARKLAEEGLALYDAGNYAAALPKFARADELFQAPTVELMAARCLSKLGRLVESADRYRAATKLDPGASDVFKRAVEDAEKELQEITPRVPKLVLRVSGAAPGEVEVVLDGAKVPSAMIGIERPTDPGHHKVSARRGEDLVAKEVDLAEGASVEVALAFRGPSPAGDSSGSTQRTIGWVTAGVGAAGLVFGAVMLGVVSSKKSGLTATSGCTTDLVCPNSAKVDVDGYNGLRSVPAIGFIVGGAALAAGATLILTAPRSRSAPPAVGRVVVTPFVAPAVAGVKGTF